MAYSENMTGPEREVGEFLSSLGVWWKYEHPLFVYDDNERPRIWAPDFFLPKLGIYIEVCGTYRTDYDYRERIYDKNVSKIIFVHYYKEEEKWRTFLVQRLLDIQLKRLQDTKYVIDLAVQMGIKVQIV
ncbi:MAG: hypothetical protein NWE88_04755 [Candidatus Bathyarchaeota archaeon]|nr:hypothetical protein [Candidatus Bathyarchaeota archaeon]